MAKELTPAQCVLLTVHYASEANIKALHTFTPARLDALDPELVLRILLTYLPESTEPSEYTEYIREVATRLYLDVNREDVEIDVSPVADIADEQAQKKVKKLRLLDLVPAEFPPHAPKDILIRFLCHRAALIDQETGLSNLIPQLIEPFLDRDQWLRMWYISVCLPMLRLNLEYYPDESNVTLQEFGKVDGPSGIELLLGHATQPEHVNSSESTVGRDLRGLVGPWMYGHSERKRRRLDGDKEDYQLRKVTSDLSKIGLTGVSEDDKTGHDWEYVNTWLVHTAEDNFPLVTNAVEEWDGPGDVDLGGLGDEHTYLDEETQQKLELQYAQAAFASCYAVKSDTPEVIDGAHGMLVRLAHLLDFEPPPDLATSVEALPKIDDHASLLHDSSSHSLLEPDALLQPEHPLTSPLLQTFQLLQMLVYSAYQLNGLGHPISIGNVAKYRFFSDEDQQLALLQKILHALAGQRKDEHQWLADKARLVWLWNWGIDSEDEGAQKGAGMLGLIDRETWEREMLKTFTETSCYNLVANIYLKSGQARLPAEVMEKTILSSAMHAYDNASNGNRTRGGMKKASDIIATFKMYFPHSAAFRQTSALISATHALSFYSLALQHGVPFQPVSIRVSQDPLTLISKVLDQNPRSYTKLDDLIDIGRNLVSAGLPQDSVSAEAEEPALEDADGLPEKRLVAERRVTVMAIEAALREDDFETAYSYIVNRLTPSAGQSAPPTDATSHKLPSNHTDNPISDDISWRAAFLAGRYRRSTSSPPSLRRLEQRTELLSLALLLAPTSALSEILGVWRRCEEEMTTLQASEAQKEETFDDAADKRSTLPGNFTIESEDPAMVLNQKRREVGRMGGSTRADDEAPMSMFDVARGAAKALSRTFPQARSTSGTAAAAPAAPGTISHGMSGSIGSLRSMSGSEGDHAEGEGRVRKRDMVANAVSGGLASGLGWVLGATPVVQQGGSKE